MIQNKSLKILNEVLEKLKESQHEKLCDVLDQTNTTIGGAYAAYVEVNQAIERLETVKEVLEREQKAI